MSIKQIYQAEFNYYQAVTGWRGSYAEYIKWRTALAIKQFN